MVVEMIGCACVRRRRMVLCVRGTWRGHRAVPIESRTWSFRRSVSDQSLPSIWTSVVSLGRKGKSRAHRPSTQRPSFRNPPTTKPTTKPTTPNPFLPFPCSLPSSLTREPRGARDVGLRDDGVLEVGVLQVCKLQVHLFGGCLCMCACVIGKQLSKEGRGISRPDPILAPPRCAHLVEVRAREVRACFGWVGVWWVGVCGRGKQHMIHKRPRARATTEQSSPRKPLPKTKKKKTHP